MKHKFRPDAHSALRLLIHKLYLWEQASLAFALKPWPWGRSKSIIRSTKQEDLKHIQLNSKTIRKLVDGWMAIWMDGWMGKRTKWINFFMDCLFQNFTLSSPVNMEMGVLKYLFLKKLFSYPKDNSSTLCLYWRYLRPSPKVEIMIMTTITMYWWQCKFRALD